MASQRDDILYVFFHVPKCAGTTLAFHVRSNFQPHQTLCVYMAEKDRFYNIRTGTFGTLASAEDVDDYLDSLSAAEKAGIQVIFGHNVYRTIHEPFDKTPRYVTFLRDPAERLVSWYNMLRTMLARNQSFEGFPTAPHLVTPDGQARSFEDWFVRVDEHYPTLARNNMTKFFAKYFLRDQTPQHQIGSAMVDTIRSALDEFYLVGTTESYDRQSAVLYDEMGMETRFDNQNVSTKYQAAGEVDRCRELVRAGNELDQALYDYAGSRAAGWDRARGESPGAGAASHSGQGAAV